jgi:hypothetical protein
MVGRFELELRPKAPFTPLGTEFPGLVFNDAHDAVTGFLEVSFRG